MSKKEFMEKLKSSLSESSCEDIEKTLNFYSESIDDRIEEGMSEEAAVSSVGDINTIINNIQTEETFGVLIGKKIKKSKDSAKNKTLWMILAICGFPFWFPIFVAIVAVIISIYISLWAIIISIFAAILSFAVASLAAIIVAIIALIKGNPLLFLAYLGLCIALAGLFIMTLKPTIVLAKKIVILTGKFIKWVKSLLIGNEAKS